MIFMHHNKTKMCSDDTNENEEEEDEKEKQQPLACVSDSQCTSFKFHQYLF